MLNFGSTLWGYILASPGGESWGTELTLAGIVGPLWSPGTLFPSWGALRGKAACEPHFCPPGVLAPQQAPALLCSPAGSWWVVLSSMCHSLCLCLRHLWGWSGH